MYPAELGFLFLPPYVLGLVMWRVGRLPGGILFGGGEQAEMF
jgi:hypothetical protein